VITTTTTTPGYSPLLEDLVERFPDLFEQKVLQHLDPMDRTFLVQGGNACRPAVAASGLPAARGDEAGGAGDEACEVGDAQAQGVLHVRRAAGRGRRRAGAPRSSGRVRLPLRSPLGAGAWRC
jgi:hypothetical protein